MRILHVLDHSAPLHSGYTFRTLNILREQRRLGWETFAVTGPKQQSGDDLEETVDGWHFYRTPGSAAAAARWPVFGELMLMRRLEKRLAELVDELKPDIIHAHSPALNGLPALKVAHHCGVPLVYEVRAFWEDAAVQHGTSREDGLRYRATRTLETRVLRRADAVTTICDGLRGAITARGVPKSRVTVIPNAVDPDQFQPEGDPDPALLDELGLKNCFVLGFAGSFYSYEGLDVLVDAMSGLRDSAVPVKLLLVGGGPETERIVEQVRRLGVSDSVVFTGRVPQDRVPVYYDLIDLLVYPRRHGRLTDLVTPLKPLEAMAQRKLVAASNVGGHRELISDGETGFLFEPDSSQALAACIRSLVQADSKQLDRVRLAGRRFVEQERRWAHSVAGYQQVYGDLTRAGEQ